MRVSELLRIVPIALGLGACATEEQVPGDDLPAQRLMITDAETSPAWVRIRSISWAGSGCPAGSVSENLSSEFTAFTLLFDAYVAELGPGLALSLSRRNCQILVDLEFPQGWTFSVFDVDYRGFVSVEPGVWGVQQSSYHFQGQISTARLQTRLDGPIANDYQVRDSLGLSAVIWAPCGANRALIINSEVRLVNGGGQSGARGVMTTDSIDGQVTHIYGLQWQRCTL